MTASGDLEARLQPLEDERDIRELTGLNWLLADAGPAEAFVALYAEDCVIDLGRLVRPDADTIVEGLDGVRARYTDPGHAGWEGKSHHLSAGPVAIVVDGDEAQAVGYAMTHMFIDGQPKKIVIGFNFWQLRRAGGRWRIVRRFARRLGDGDVPALFAPILRSLLGAR
jgi:hypothetical protein